MGQGDKRVLLRRWITSQAAVEDHESIERALNLKKLLATEGLSLSEARQLRDNFRRGHGNLLAAEANAVITKEIEAEASGTHLEYQTGDASGPIPYEYTTAGMATKAGAELDALEGQLKYAIGELAHNMTEARAHQLYKAQDAWEKYRGAEAEFAGLLWEGGTGAQLLRLGRMIDLTEQRLRDIALSKAESDL